jgi:signal transduction histidine kinase
MVAERGAPVGDVRIENAILESLGTPAFIARPPGVLDLINTAARELTGLDVPIGAPLDTLLLSLGARFTETGARLEHSPLVEGLAGRVWRGEVAFANRVTHEEKIVDVLVRPVRDASGAVVAAVMTLHDLTELRNVEHEQEQFLSIVSHELRTPLTPLKALAQLLMTRLRRSRGGQQPLDLDSLERNLALIERQVDRMNGLVTDLLSVSRAGRGSLEIMRSPFDLATTVRDTVEKYVVATREEGRHTFIVDAPGTLTVNADQARIEQALMNLVGNAVKYSPRGGEVHVTLAQRDGTAQVSITDRGIGVSAADLPRLGGAFVRGTGKAGTFAGMGIGLHVAKLMAEAHGGSLEIESAGEDQGTTVRVSLPV